MGDHMSLQDVSQDANQRDRFAYLVNSVPNRARDRQIEGREILEKSGYLPADQHILIQVLDRGTKSIGLNEKVDLREEGIEQFRAFSGDRIYAFTVDLRGYEWGASIIAEAELRGYAGLTEDHIFTLDRTDTPDKLIEDGSDIDFNDRGAERLKVVARPMVTVKVNNKPVTLRFGWHTGAEIKAAAIAQGVEIRLDFTLDEEKPDGDTQVIGDDDPTFISGGEVFGAVDHHEDS